MVKRLKTPKLDEIARFAEMYLTHDARFTDGSFSREQIKYYFYVLQTLNLSKIGEIEERNKMRPIIYKKAAQAFGVPVEKISEAWDLVMESSTRRYYQGKGEKV